MKKFMLILSVIVYSTPGFLMAQDSTGYVSLNVMCNLTTAQIIIDSTNLGSPPLLNHKIEKGEHKLIILNRESSNKWQVENYKRELFIKSDTIINIDFQKYYFIDSDPFNTEVIFNDTVLGLTPIRLYREASFSGTMVFKKDEYIDKTITLSLQDTSSNIFVKLKEARYGQTDPVVFKNKKTDFKSGRNVLAISSLGIGALGSAISAIYFKNTANNAYDDYTQTYDRSQYDKANQNDTYSLISLIVMQGAIAGLIYFLFFD